MVWAYLNQLTFDRITSSERGIASLANSVTYESRPDIEDNHISAYCSPAFNAKAWIHAFSIKGLTMKGNSAANIATTGSSNIVEEKNDVIGCKEPPRS